MIATLVITAFFGFLYVCAAIMDARNLARRPMKVPEWRPSIPMYFVKDEFGVTHWLGLDLELAKLYLEPGWKLGEGHPNIKVDWTWMTYDQVFPKPTTGPIETVGPVGPDLRPKWLCPYCKTWSPSQSCDCPALLLKQMRAQQPPYPTLADTEIRHYRLDGSCKCHQPWSLPQEPRRSEYDTIPTERDKKRSAVRKAPVDLACWKY
jgi:hypothetical protein